MSASRDSSFQHCFDFDNFKQNGKKIVLTRDISKFISNPNYKFSGVKKEISGKHKFSKKSSLDQIKSNLNRLQHLHQKMTDMLNQLSSLQKDKKRR
jgi:hypothetical protein